MKPFHFGEPISPRPGERAVSIPVSLNSKAELLSFLASAIPLPAYFGHNWDALEECLQGMGATDDSRTFLNHGDIPMSGAPVDRLTYLKILAGAASGSKHLIVNFPEHCRSEVCALLATDSARP